MNFFFAKITLGINVTCFFFIRFVSLGPYLIIWICLVTKIWGNPINIGTFSNIFACLKSKWNVRNLPFISNQKIFFLKAPCFYFKFYFVLPGINSEVKKTTKTDALRYSFSKKSIGKSIVITSIQYQYAIIFSAVIGIGYSIKFLAVIGIGYSIIYQVVIGIGYSILCSVIG